MTYDELQNLLYDLTNKWFPKGECKERGKALILVAETLYQFKLATEKSNSSD